MAKVFVGLSGGVDSATSAALLKQQGHEVTGVFIKIWQPEFIECTWREDRLDAMRVAAALEISFREIDLSAEYQKNVVESMIADYSRGITPNPDVLCNKYIKFGEFLRYALAEGADYVATGHYARVGDDHTLRRGRDIQKDQSYFLYRMRAEDLARTLFPVGEFTKTEIREAAARFDLPVAHKADSQGLCFVGDVTMRDFLARFIEIEGGEVLDTHGALVGEHEGAAFYTLGQRHGFTHPKSAEPHYVVATDPIKNTITVSTERKDALRSVAALHDMHWINAVPNVPLACSAQARYREQPVSVTVEKDGDAYRAVFTEPHLLSSGQSLVLYDGESCLGGGIIS